MINEKRACEARRELIQHTFLSRVRRQSCTPEYWKALRQPLCETVALNLIVREGVPDQDEVAELVQTFRRSFVLIEETPLVVGCSNKVSAKVGIRCVLSEFVDSTNPFADGANVISCFLLREVDVETLLDLATENAEEDLRDAFLISQLNLGIPWAGDIIHVKSKAPEPAAAGCRAHTGRYTMVSAGPPALSFGDEGVLFSDFSIKIDLKALRSKKDGVLDRYFVLIAVPRPRFVFERNLPLTVVRNWTNFLVISQPFYITTNSNQLCIDEETVSESLRIALFDEAGTLADLMAELQDLKTAKNIVTWIRNWHETHGIELRRCCTKKTGQIRRFNADTLQRSHSFSAADASSTISRNKRAIDSDSFASAEEKRRRKCLSPSCPSKDSRLMCLKDLIIKNFDQKTQIDVIEDIRKMVEQTRLQPSNKDIFHLQNEQPSTLGRRTMTHICHTAKRVYTLITEELRTAEGVKIFNAHIKSDSLLFIMRSLKETDSAFYHRLHKNPTNVRLYDDGSPKDDAWSEKWIKYNVDRWAIGDAFSEFVVCLLDGTQVGIATTGPHISTGGHEIETKAGECSVALVIDAAYWMAEFGSKVTETAVTCWFPYLQYAGQEIGGSKLERVHASALLANVGSQRILEKFGFRRVDEERNEREMKWEDGTTILEEANYILILKTM